MAEHQSQLSVLWLRSLVMALVIVGWSFMVNLYDSSEQKESLSKVNRWLIENGFSEFIEDFDRYGIVSLQAAAQLSEAQVVLLVAERNIFGNLTKEKLLAACIRLKAELILDYWLECNGFAQHIKEIKSRKIYSLGDLLVNEDVVMKQVFLSDQSALNKLQMLKLDQKNFEDYPLQPAQSYIWLKAVFSITWLTLVGCAKIFILGSIIVVAAVLLCAFLFLKLIVDAFKPAGSSQSDWFSQLMQSLFRNIRQQRVGSSPDRSSRNRNPPPHGNPGQQGDQPSWLQRLVGHYFDAKRSTVHWNLPDRSSVGNEVVLTVKFLNRNSLPYNAKAIQVIRTEVVANQKMLPSTFRYAPQGNVITVHFTPTHAGSYRVSVMADGNLVADSPYSRTFVPGSVEAARTSIIVPSSLLILEQGISEKMTFDERDKFDNRCVSPVEELWKYSFDVTEFGNEEKRISPQLSFLSNVVPIENNQALIVVQRAGVYSASIMYDGQAIKNKVVLVVLTDAEMAEVDRNVRSPNWNLWYEAYLVSEYRRASLSALSMDQSSFGRRKIYCYLSPKYLSLREYYWKIFSKKLYTFRVKPATKITLRAEKDSVKQLDSFEISSNNGQVVVLFCQQRNVVVATFMRYLLKNIGGSESFEAKKTYFFQELNKLNLMKTHQSVSLKVTRQNLLKDSMKQLKNLSQPDWWKKFEITFIGEIGLDYGGIMREWMHLLVEELFKTDGGLFKRFDKDDKQSLIHPNPFRSENYAKLKCFEFAGQLVGKCLVECACGSYRQQYVKARFTRSFLSQILGLGVTWAHFESDDKDYYVGKVKYLLENDPCYLDIFFSEDVYDHLDKLVKTVDLKPGGSKVEVTQANKLEYLQRLAEYRLAESVKEEINSFVKGLNSIVPDNLLSIFDENELELLICGMESISVSDWKANALVQSNGRKFDDVIDWFWIVVSGFSQEELARLLQFTTGCSQLPPAGFSELTPKFLISYSGGSDVLPIAHTCFNNLCLPAYSSMDVLKKMILLAINEGVEGFGLT